MTLRTLVLAPALVLSTHAGSVAVARVTATATPVASPAATPASRELRLVTEEDVDPRRILPAPPPDEAPITLAERAELHRIAQTVTQERMAQAHFDDAHEDPSLLAPTLGPKYDLARMPALTELLHLVQTDAAISASTAKAVFQRRRPWSADPTIATCDPEDKPFTSYPSGHATLGYALALTMTRVLPDLATPLLQRAADYAYSREVCGAHYHSDTQASQALATALVTSLAHHPEFQTLVARAHAEAVTTGLAVSDGRGGSTP